MTNEKFEELRILCEQSSALKTCCRQDSKSNMPCTQANCPYIQFFNDLDRYVDNPRLFCLPGGSMSGITKT
jgi:hypothetical protein